MCGGTASTGLNQGANVGLSPRVRGNPVSYVFPVRSLRSIPACAGEPTVLTGGAATVEVYPRVCGGTSSGKSRTTHHQGLSPRVRGNLGRVDERGLGRGSIPACAGEPCM